MISKTPKPTRAVLNKGHKSNPSYRHATTSNWWGTDAIQFSKPVTSMVRPEVTTAPACIVCETEPRSCGRQAQQSKRERTPSDVFSL